MKACLRHDGTRKRREPEQEADGEETRLFEGHGAAADPGPFVQRRHVPGPDDDEVEEARHHRSRGREARNLRPQPEREERRGDGDHRHVHEHVGGETRRREAGERPHPGGGEHRGAEQQGKSPPHRQVSRTRIGMVV